MGFDQRTLKDANLYQNGKRPKSPKCCVEIVWFLKMLKGKNRLFSVFGPFSECAGGNLGFLQKSGKGSKGFFVSRKSDGGRGRGEEKTPILGKKGASIQISKEFWTFSGKNREKWSFGALHQHIR